MPLQAIQQAEPDLAELGGRRHGWPTGQASEGEGGGDWRR